MGTEIDKEQYLIARINILEDLNRSLQDQVAKLTVILNMKEEDSTKDEPGD